MIKEIRILPMQDVKIVKRINIITQNRFDNDIIIGYMLYERNFTPTYKFEQKQEEEKDSLIIGSYPKQEDFPKDEVDEILLNVVLSKYPKSTVHNVMLFTSSDLEMIENWKKRPFEQLEINIAPDFSGHNLEMLRERIFTQFRMKTNIYVAEGSSELIKDIVLFGHCDLNRHEEIYRLLENVVFL